MKKVKKQKKNKRPNLDKMSFEKRERYRDKMRKEAAYTKTFRTPQSFGAASPVRHISVEEYLKEKSNEH
jgi:hypothetical protein